MSAPTQPEHGVKAVRDQVAALLVADLPGRITDMTRLWALGEREIPQADMVTSGETPDNALDHRGEAWIEVITPRLLPRTRTVGLTLTGGSVNRYRYSARIYVWTLADTWPDAMDKRDRLATAVQDALFDYPTLAVLPATGDTGFLINSSSISQEFGEPYRARQKGGSPRVWAPALLSYEIDHEWGTTDITTRPDLGRFDSVDLRVVLLPYTHPIGG